MRKMGKGPRERLLLRGSGKQGPPSIGKPGWGIVREGSGNRKGFPLWRPTCVLNTGLAASGCSTGGGGGVYPSISPCVTLDEVFVPTWCLRFPVSGEGERGRGGARRLSSSFL